MGNQARLYQLQIPPVGQHGSDGLALESAEVFRRCACRHAKKDGKPRRPVLATPLTALTSPYRAPSPTTTNGAQ
jgi:hypothetical protein